EVIDSKVFRLVAVDEFRALFDAGDSDETIFHLYYDESKGEFSDYYGHIMTYYLSNPYTPRTNLTLAVPRERILQIYPDYARDRSDKRVAAFFESVDFSVSGAELRPIHADPLQNGEREIMFAKFRKPKNLSYG